MAPTAEAAALRDVDAWGVESLGSHTQPAELRMTTTAASFMSRSSQFLTHSVARSLGSESVVAGRVAQPVDSTHSSKGKVAFMDGLLPQASEAPAASPEPNERFSPVAYKGCMRLGSVAALVLLWATGCATTPRVTLETERGSPIVYRGVETRSVEVGETEFTLAVAQLALELKWSVLFEHSTRAPSPHLLLASAESPVDDLPNASLSLVPDHLPRGLMQRRMMALSFAFDTVWEGVGLAVKDVMDPQALRTMVVSVIGTSLLMLVAPEPVTKFVAIALTACLIAYLGTGPVWNMGQAFLQFLEDTKLATSLDAVKEAGHRYGKVIGDNGARVLIMVAMAALGGRSSMSAQGPKLPGFARAALRAEAEGGFRLPAALTGEVHSIALPAAGVLNIALAPTAVAAVAMGPGSSPNGGIQGDPEGQVHHICTDKNNVSDASGGPWTPAFEDIFERAGMKLSDPENQVRIQGHQGPHPREYHTEVYRRIQYAMQGCRGSAQCRAALVNELARIALELTTEGSRLWKLVTKNIENP